MICAWNFGHKSRWSLTTEIIKRSFNCTYKRPKILHHYLDGYKAPTIAKLRLEEGLKASFVGISKFLIKYQETGSIGQKQGSGRPSIIMGEIKKVVEEQMRMDDETTAHKLHKMLTSKGYSISRSIILRY